MAKIRFPVEFFCFLQRHPSPRATFYFPNNAYALGTDFGGNCAEKGFSLSVPTVTRAAAGATPSLASVNSPTQTTPNQTPPAGIPLSFGAPTASAFVSGSNNGSSPTPARATAASQQSQGGGGTGRGSGNAIRVGDRVEITSLLFILCVVVVLVS
jgi:hypothetical protein